MLSKFVELVKAAHLRFKCSAESLNIFSLQSNLEILSGMCFLYNIIIDDPLYWYIGIFFCVPSVYFIDGDCSESFNCLTHPHVSKKMYIQH